MASLLDTTGQALLDAAARALGDTTGQAPAAGGVSLTYSASGELVLIVAAGRALWEADG